ncbi:hypothetical protein J6590_099633 [Homalodisca vitripennis]|nr:hypothetical protein J6590_100706 [Homalodisca vitripennis]KAG8333976.1 hypothetical protein J6590_099633 [Homalodisca vitripennis]
MNTFVDIYRVEQCIRSTGESSEARLCKKPRYANGVFLSVKLLTIDLCVSVQRRFNCFQTYGCEGIRYQVRTEYVKQITDMNELQTYNRERAKAVNERFTNEPIMTLGGFVPVKPLRHDPRYVHNSPHFDTVNPSLCIAFRFSLIYSFCMKELQGQRDNEW